MDNSPRSKFNEACEYIDKKYAECIDDDLQADTAQIEAPVQIKEIP
ncbi:hypothetical protein ACO0LL_13805 [Undibacterium sp. TC4M20W]